MEEIEGADGQGHHDEHEQDQRLDHRSVVLGREAAYVSTVSSAVRS